MNPEKQSHCKTPDQINITRHDDINPFELMPTTFSCSCGETSSGDTRAEAWDALEAHVKKHNA